MNYYGMTGAAGEAPEWHPAIGDYPDEVDPNEPRQVPTPSATPRDPPANVTPGQVAIDVVDLSSMESFPCSDPPGYTPCHA